MGVRDLDHINIRTDRLAETRDFFVDVLGLTEGWRPDVPVPGYWLYAGDRPCVHLAGADAPAPDAVSAIDHFAFKIDDFEGMVAQLTERGVKHAIRGLPEGGIRQILCRDPNGVSIELNYTAMSAAAE
jgi:catechol 2,3-dioxygenase-like lactoylglutathione lyase family enzyme